MANPVNLKDYLGIDDLRTALKALETDNKEFGKSAEGVYNILKEKVAQYKKEIESLRDTLKGTSPAENNSNEVIVSLSKRVKEVIDAFNQAKAAGQGLTDTINLQKNAISQLQKEQKAYEQAIKAVKNEENKESEQVKQLEAQYKALSMQINGLSAELKTAKRATDVINDSYTSLSRELASNREQLRNMANAFDLTTGKINKNNQAAVTLQRTIISQDKALKSMDGSMGNFQRNVGNYSGAINLLQGNFISLASSIGPVALAIVALQQVIAAGDFVIQTATKVERLDVAIKNTSGGFEDYQRNLQFIEQTANSLGLDIFALAEGFKLLAGSTEETALQGDYTRKIFLSVAQAAAAMQLNSEDTLGAIRALGQMLSKGTVSAEELRGQLAERIPGAFRRAAESIGVTTEKLSDMLKAGDVMALELLPKLADELQKTYGDESAKNIDTIAGSTTYLKNQTSLLIAEFSKTSGINSFFSSISRGLGDILGSMRTLTKSQAWTDFFLSLTGNPAAVASLNAKVAVTKAKENESAFLNDFRQTPKAQRDYVLNREKNKLEDIGIKFKFDPQIVANQKAFYDKLLAADKEATDSELKLQKELNDQKNKAAQEQREKEAKEAEKKRNKAIAELENQYKEELQLQKAAESQRKAELKLQNTEGKISDEDYIKQLNEIEVQGANQRLQIIFDYNNKFKKYNLEKNDDAISADTDLVNSKIKLLEAGIKLEEDAYKESLSAIKNYADVLEATVKNDLQDKFGIADANYETKVSNAELNFAKTKGKPKDKRVFDSAMNQARIEQIQEYINALKDAQQQQIQINSDLEKAEIQALTDKIEKEKKLNVSLTNFEVEQAKIVEKYKEQSLKDSLQYKKQIAEEERRLGRQLREEELADLKRNQEQEIEFQRQKFEVLTTAVNGFFEIRQANIRREMDAVNAQKEYEIELAGDNDEAKKKIEKEFEKRQKELRIKEAKAQKAQAVFQIALSTAQAIMSVLAQAPKFDFGVTAGILAASYGVLGAIQAGVVLAKPLPQYAKGKKKGDSYEGMALVGEAGAELVERNGKIQYFDKPTLTYTDPNTRVYSATETSRILSTQNEDTNRIIRSISSNNTSSTKLNQYRVEQMKQIHKPQDYSLIFNRLEEKIKSGIENVVSRHQLADGSIVDITSNAVLKDVSKQKKYR